ncbi:MAG TPA: hypothetical protein VGK87_10865, partial [Anaerolineae bacterium]
VAEAVMPPSFIFVLLSLLYFNGAYGLMWHLVTVSGTVGVPWSLRLDALCFIGIFLGSVLIKTLLLWMLCIFASSLPCKENLSRITLPDALFFLFLFIVLVWPEVRKRWRETRATTLMSQNHK